MNDFNEYETKILDVIRDKNIRAGHSLGENVLFSISPAERRSAAIESLIGKSVLERKGNRLFVTEHGEAVIYS